MRASLLRKCLIAGLASLHALGAQAQTVPEADKDVEVVEVAGYKDPEWRPYRDMLKGLDAFDKYRKFAPAAELRFLLRPNKPGLKIENPRLAIEGRTRVIDVPVRPDNSFSLPRDQQASDEDAQLRVLNQKKETVRWRPDVQTPGLAPNVRRLGDLRLQCEVTWAIERNSMSFFMRSSLTAVGGPCDKSVFGVFFGTAQKISGARIAGTQRTLAISKDGMAFRPPLHEHDLPDDTLIEIEYAGPAATAGGQDPVR